MQEKQNMSNITKIMTFTSTVEQLIRNKEPGFTDRLPGQRELATRFNLSQSLVHIGMTELKKRGIIEIEPYKGASVAVSQAKEKSTQVSDLAIAVCEDNPRQRSFWLRAVQLFEQTSPDVRVTTRFVPSKQPLEQAAFGTHNTVIVRPEDFRHIPLPCVPLSEVFSKERLADLQSRLLPGLHNADWSITLPFQLQVMAQVYNISGGVETPPNDFPAYLEWVTRNYGPHSIPVQNLDLLRDCCGIDRASMLLPENGSISPEFFSFLSALETIGKNQLMELACEKDCDQIRFLLDGRIRTAEVFSHRWTEHGIFQNKEYNFARPRSSARRRKVPHFLSVALLAGYEKTSDAERRWFEFLASPELQILQMEEGLGLSPYTDFLKHSCGERLQDIAEWALQTEFDDTREPLLETIWSELLRNLRDSVVLPLIFGQISADQALGILAKKHLPDSNAIRQRIAEQLQIN